MQETKPQIENTSKLIQEILLVNTKQSDALNHINIAIQKLNSVTQQNLSLEKEVPANSENLAIQADNLRKIISFFEIDTKKRKN